MTTEATIRRGVRNARYAAIPNHVFEDSRLSMEARWLLGYLLSKPDHWKIIVGDISHKGNCGRDKARKMLAELVEFGYAEREQSREDGKFRAAVYVINDEPSIGIHSDNSDGGESVAFLPQPEKPSPVTPSPVLPSPVKTAHSNNSHLENTDLSSERARDRGFEKGRPSVDADLIKRVQRFCTGTGYRAGEWKGWGSSTIGHIAKQFSLLSEDQQEAACKWRDEFLSKCAREGVKPMPVANFFRDLVWEILVDQAASAPAAAPARVTAPPFGPAWAGVCMEALLAGPVECGQPEVTRESRIKSYEAMAEVRGADKAREFYRRLGCDFDHDGNLILPPDFEDLQWRDHLLRHGFPAVNALHKAALSGFGLTGSDAVRGLQLAPLMVFVPIDTPLFEDWRQFHVDKGWPWPSIGKMRGLYLPDGGPEQLQDFERVIRDHDHAA